MAPRTADPQTLRLWLMLAVVGAILCLVGWYRWGMLVGWWSR
jgi:hypothetical protein